VASAGLDKTVQFWDLESLRYKFARTGPKSGIQCLAFDGSRLLLAGGFDYTVSAVLCCAVLYCAGMGYVVLCCAALCCAVLLGYDVLCIAKKGWAVLLDM
jgi:hypothetical protein